MIIDLPRFLTTERPLWAELESILNRLEADPSHTLDLAQSKRLHYLYERATSDLGKIATFASEPELRLYLEGLVSRAYSEIHESRRRPHRLAPLDWFFKTFPQTFRRRARAFWLSLIITVAGCVFGGLAVAFDSDAKSSVLPKMFAGHLADPRERVAREERQTEDRLAGHKSTFSAQLMQNNISVSINAMALGMTYGLGTIVLLFFNGVILGLVGVDYIMAGQGRFLAGWLLPHGSIEIPAILIAGQAGLLIGGALIGWGNRASLRARLRELAPDLVTLIGGVAVMLIWAGFVEAFLSQYHEPVLPYELKIAFGVLEMALLIVFLMRSGRGESRARSKDPVT